MIQKGSLRFGVYLASSAIKSHGDDLIKPRVYLTAMKNKMGLNKAGYAVGILLNMLLK